MKEVLNEGLIQNMVAGILKLIYSGKIDVIKKDIGKTNKNLSKDLEALRQTITNFNKYLDDPEMIEAFKAIGVDITTWPRLKR